MKKINVLNGFVINDIFKLMLRTSFIILKKYKKTKHPYFTSLLIFTFSIVFLIVNITSSTSTTKNLII